MSQEAGRTIAIVGSGASGKGVVHHLAKYYAKQDINRIVIIDPLGIESGGEGHNAPDDSARLNDTVERMGLDNRAPDHFAQYANKHSLRDFLSREFYRSYLVNTFGAGMDVIEYAGIEIVVRETRASALGLDRETGQAILFLEDGSPPIALASLQDLTLAPGHLPRKSAQELATKFPSYVPRATAVGEKDYDFNNPDSVVVCIGGSLAFVDAFNALRRKNYQGKIIVFSPSGEIPPPRDVDADWGEFQPQLIPSVIPLNTTAAEMDGLIQAEIERVAAETNLSKREIVGGLNIQSLCNRLDLDQRQVFYRSYGRHYLAAVTPIPPEVHAVLNDAIEKGQVEIRAERLDINTLQNTEGGIFIPGENIFADLVVDCRGYATLIGDDYDNPLLSQLIRDGIIVANPDGGVAHVQNVTVGRDGQLGPCIVGPLTLMTQQCFGIETFRPGYDRVAGYLDGGNALTHVKNHLRDLALADITTVLKGQKAIGWLPTSAIEKVTGQSVEEWIKNFSDSECIFFIRPQMRRHQKALFVYHPEKIQTVINRHYDILTQKEFPTEPMKFAGKILCSRQFDHELLKIIAEAFADDTYTGEIRPLEHPSPVDASVRGFNNASLGEILTANTAGINPFEFMHPDRARDVIHTLREANLEDMINCLDEKWQNHNLYVLSGEGWQHFERAGRTTIPPPSVITEAIPI